MRDGPRCIAVCPTKALALVDEGMLEALGKSRRIEAVERAEAALRGGLPDDAFAAAFDLSEEVGR